VASSAYDLIGEFKRGLSPLSFSSPLSFEGEGDTGGEVDKKIYVTYRRLVRYTIGGVF
jgi:hypothetical protein